MKQSKDKKGRFTKKVTVQQLTKEMKTKNFIEEVKTEIYNGYLYPERIQKAYQMITGLDQSNLVMMKRTVLAYNSN